MLRGEGKETNVSLPAKLLHKWARPCKASTLVPPNRQLLQRPPLRALTREEVREDSAEEGYVRRQELGLIDVLDGAKHQDVLNHILRGETEERRRAAFDA